jgi:polyisoprenoid-binding protein YceI
MFGARLRAWRLPLGLACLLALALVPIPPRAVAAPQPGEFALDEALSSARFIVHMRFRLRAQGRIGGMAGTLRGDAKEGWAVSVRADGRKLRVGGPRWMERTTRSDDFLAVDSHPDIRFESERFSDEVLRKGGNVRGQLRLRGLTRPVSLRLLPSGCDKPGRDCDLRVNGTISRKEFGMTAYPASVKDDVELQLRVRLRPAAAR